jgi:hypothetical protein
VEKGSLSFLTTLSCSLVYYRTDRFSFTKVFAIPSVCLMSETGLSVNDEQPPSTPQLCISIVQDYANGHSSKVAAVKSILAAFNKSSAYEDFQSDQVDAAMGMYFSMLDQHDDAQKIAAV